VPPEARGVFRGEPGACQSDNIRMQKLVLARNKVRDLPARKICGDSLAATSSSFRGQLAGGDICLEAVSFSLNLGHLALNEVTDRDDAEKLAQVTDWEMADPAVCHDLQ